MLNLGLASTPQTWGGGDGVVFRAVYHPGVPSWGCSPTKVVWGARVGEEPWAGCCMAPRGGELREMHLGGEALCSRKKTGSNI